MCSAVEVAPSAYLLVTSAVGEAIHAIDFNNARLLESCIKESGPCPHAPSISSLGLWFNNNSQRISVGLRLGALLCAPNQYSRCR